MTSEISAEAGAQAIARSKKIALSLEARGRGGTIVLHCQGRLIFRHEANELARTVTDILLVARRMVVDLAGIEAIDSSGLGELVLLHMWADSSGYTLKFSGARKSLRKALELSNLVQVLNPYSSVPEAIAAMQEDEACSA